MKSLRIALMLTFVVVVFVFCGVVSALNSGDLTATMYPSSDPLPIGSTVIVRIMLINNAAQQLQIDGIGVNFDWQNETEFIGPKFSTPIALNASGSYTTDPIIFQVPLINVTAGTHSYHIGVDGTDASGATFQWDSPTATIAFAYPNTGPTPTPTASSDGDGGQTGGGPNWAIYIAIIAVVAIGIAVAFIVMEIRKKPKKGTPAAESAKPAAESPKPANDQPLENIEGDGI